MGSYLQAGLVMHMRFPKENKNKPTDVSAILSFLQKQLQLDTDLYTATEEKDKYLLSMKKDIFSEHIHSFLETQFSYMDENEHRQKEWNVLQTKLKECSFDEMGKLASGRYYASFSDAQTTVLYRNPNVWFDTLQIEVDMIVFAVEGKIIAEQFHLFSHYMAKLIRLSDPKNPLTHATFIEVQ